MTKIVGESGLLRLVLSLLRFRGNARRRISRSRKSTGAYRRYRRRCGFRGSPRKPRCSRKTASTSKRFCSTVRGELRRRCLSGSLFAASVALPQVMLADLTGADLVNVAHGIGVQGSRLMVRPEIRKVEDLKGKRIGISSLGSAGDLLFGYVLRKYGIDTTRDVIWLAVGNTAERLQALMTGAVDAADHDLPIRRRGRAQRLSRLARCQERNRLSDRLGGDAAPDDQRRPRYGDALRPFLCRRHRVFSRPTKSSAKEF